MSGAVAKRAKTTHTAGPDESSLLLHASTTEKGDIKFNFAGVQISSIPFGSFILEDDLKALLTVTDPGITISTTFASIDKISFSYSATASQIFASKTYALLQLPVLKATEGLRAHLALQQVFQYIAQSSLQPSIANLFSDLRPILLFASDPQPSKKLKHRLMKIAWDKMASYSIIFTDATGLQRLRIDVAKKLINITSLIKFQYQLQTCKSSLGSALAQTLGNVWQSFEAVNALLTNMGADGEEIVSFVSEVQSKLDGDIEDYDRMLTCGTCRQVVGRHEQAIRIHGATRCFHKKDLAAENVWGCEDCAMVFYSEVTWNAHDRDH
jgi:hypothetical protein